MFNLQGSEIVVILLLALVVLGPEKLPEAVRKFTQTYAEIKKMSSGFQSELKSALDEPMREMRETADLVRDAADPRKFMAEAEAEQRVLQDTDEAFDAETGAQTDGSPGPLAPPDPSTQHPGIAASFARPDPTTSRDDIEAPAVPPSVEP